MEPQPLEHPIQVTLPQSRPQSGDVKATSRTSRAEMPPPPNHFLSFTLFLGFSSWVISLVSQAIVAATVHATKGQATTTGQGATTSQATAAAQSGNVQVRLLWFGIVIQFILLVEILEVVISGMFAYGVQISILAGLVTVFAVLGVDNNIYTTSAAQKAIGAGWLITAIIDLLWIIYFTSPPDSLFIRLASSMVSFSGRAHRHKNVGKASRSQDAFVMSPPNGSNNAVLGVGLISGLGAELGLDGDVYATQAAVDTDRLKEERMRGSDRNSGYDHNNVEVQRGPRIKSGGLWSNYTPTPPPGRRTTMSSGDGSDRADREANTQGPEREPSGRPESGTTGVSAPETPTPSQQPSHSKATYSKSLRPAPPPPTSVQPEPPNEPVVQWRAEALFDYPGAADDPNELSFKKGEQLGIIDKSGKWWEAKNMAGRRGIVPSNYLRLV